MAKRGRRRKEPGQQQPLPPHAQDMGTSPTPVPEPVPEPEPVPSLEARAPASAGLRHPLADAFIVLFLLFQIAMPLRYYLGERGDDERFSWRMFSSVRMQRCKARVNETTAAGERKVDLNRELQVAWIGMLERYRPQVVEKLLQRRCATGEVEQVRYLRRCTGTDGRELPELQVALDCKRGELTRTPGATATPAEAEVP